ncbi:MAG: hypothetical protein P8Z79_12315 [Sedimentisphaerales bacterium]
MCCRPMTHHSHAVCCGPVHDTCCCSAEQADQVDLLEKHLERLREQVKVVEGHIADARKDK